ncbi:unnamed protein product [Parnassius apollo]|uniref:(apollo) hypothetical protein n=1 Tax=Parnassius apollo TaxID=110799 RepID=A0A8S3X6D7_PARAO|nr:unnamed protein product [Parnassius apollo]
MCCRRCSWRSACTARACGRAATVPRLRTTSPRTPCASRTSGSVECVGGAAAGGSAGAQPARAAEPRPRHAQAPRARGHPAPHARAGQLSVLPALQLTKRWCTARACGRAATAPRPTTTSPRTPCASHTSRSVECVAGAAAGEAQVHSPRVRQGRDRATPKHHKPEDTLRLTHEQLEVLIGYVGAECAAANSAEEARRCAEARLPLLLRCCSTPHALLAAALSAHPLLLLLLYMKVPKVAQLVRECEQRGCSSAALRALQQPDAALARAARASTSATDRVSHALLTALAATHAHSKDMTQRAWRLEALARAVWARVSGAGARALALCGALLRGLRAEHARAPPHAHLLAALEVLPDDQLLADHAVEELHEILDCFLQIIRQGGGGGARGADGGAVAQRVGALLRRYAAARPQRAAPLLHKHRDTIAASAALASACAGASGGGGGGEASSAPAHALLALQRRTASPDELACHLQEVESWGVRLGGGWGGRECAASLLRAVAPFAAAPHAPLRAAALSLLARLLPAAPDVEPGLQAIMECLDSNQPEVAQSALDKMAELIVGIQEHAGRILARVFELGMKSRLPTEVCIARCVAAINLQRGC